MLRACAVQDFRFVNGRPGGSNPSAAPNGPLKYGFRAPSTPYSPGYPRGLGHDLDPPVNAEWPAQGITFTSIWEAMNSM